MRIANMGPMIDLKTVELELAQARSVRIAAELAGCEIEELADRLRRTHAAWLAATAHALPRAPSVRGRPQRWAFSA